MQDTDVVQREPIADLYHRFADETAATSPTWERLCRWIARTPEVLEHLGSLPGAARQPNRFLAAVRFLDGPTDPGETFRTWVQQSWPEVEQVVLARTTQTNEPGRCAVTAPVLASLPQPVALLELGASAGLCLLPDRYAYRLSGHESDGAAGGLADDRSGEVRPAGVDDRAPVLPCAVTGTPPGDPAGLVVAGRLGLDLNPLDVTQEEIRRWLRALVWPGEEDREGRLAQALALAADDPPPLRQADLTRDPARTIGDAVEELRTACPDATPVVVHSAVLAYLGRQDREAVCAAVRGSGARWLSMEGVSVVPGLEDRARALADEHDLGRTPFVLALDGGPVGLAQPHGRWVTWI